MAVLIIPGLFRKKDFYYPLKNKFQEAGFASEIVDLGYNIQNLKISSEKVFQYFKKTPEQDDVVAHSFGGIILKYLIADKPEVINYIKSITFVSVPHGGSWSALFLSMFPAAREVLPISKNLRGLQNISLPEATVNFLSEQELKVWPRKGGLLKNRIDIVIPDTDHDNIVNSEAFATKAIEFIKSNYDRIFLG